MALFKVHIFAAAFPLLLSFAILVWPPRRSLPLASCSAYVLWPESALLTLAEPFSGRAEGPHLDFNGGALVLENYWQGWLAVHPSRVGIRSSMPAHPFPSHLAQSDRFDLCLVAVGIFAVVAPLVWLLAVWHKTWQASEGISSGRR